MAKLKVLMYISLLSLTASLGDYFNVNSRVYNIFHKNIVNSVVDKTFDNIENKVESFSLKPSEDSYNINDLSLKVKKVNDEEYFVYLKYKNVKDGNVNTIDIPIYKKNNGPRLGSLKYIYNNFSQQDKVSFLQFYFEDSGSIVKNVFEDIWNNKENIYSDVKNKIKNFLDER